MKTLLIIAHTPSSNTKALAQAVYDGANQQLADNIQTTEKEHQMSVVCQSPAETIAEDVLNADAVILGTTENLAYMAGMTKDFFDRCYYSLLDKKRAMPYAIYIRAGHDGTATKRALETINNGLKWNLVQAPLIFQGEWSEDFIEQGQELGMAMVAGIEMGIF